MQDKLQPRAMKKMYALGEKRPLDLSLSENPLGCSPEVSRALKSMRVDLHDYPAPNGQLLKRTLATKFGISSDTIFIANGSESILCDLPRIFACVNDETIMPQLTFPMFKVCSDLANLKSILVPMTEELGIDLSAMAKAVSKKTALVFVCNPNNPTGSLLPKKNILEFLDALPKSVLLVVDEANIEFGGESLLSEVVRRENLLVLRTFSKGFGLANLRVGFAVACSVRIQKLEEETPLFQVSGVSEKLAVVALVDTAFIEQTQQFVSEQRVLLNTALTSMGYLVFPSEANNLFVRVPKFIRADQFVDQLAENGVSLVLGSNFEGFDNTFFRLSIRSAQTNQAFLRVMRRILDM